MSTPTEAPQTYGVADVATMFGISQPQVRRLAHVEGSPLALALIPGLGRVLRFRRAPIDTVLSGGTLPSGGVIVPMHRPGSGGRR